MPNPHPPEFINIFFFPFLTTCFFFCLFVTKCGFGLSCCVFLLFVGIYHIYLFLRLSSDSAFSDFRQLFKVLILVKIPEILMLSFTSLL